MCVIVGTSVFKCFDNRPKNSFLFCWSVCLQTGQIFSGLDVTIHFPPFLLPMCACAVGVIVILSFLLFLCDSCDFSVIVENNNNNNKLRLAFVCINDYLILLNPTESVLCVFYVWFDAPIG